MKTHSFTGGDLEHLRRESDGALDVQLLVLGTVDEIATDCIRINDHPKPGTNDHVHFSKFLTLEEVRVILILWILALGKGAPVASHSFSPFAT